MLSEWGERDARPFAWVRPRWRRPSPGAATRFHRGRTRRERTRRKGRPHEPVLAAAGRDPAGAVPAAEVPLLPRTARGSRARRLPRPPRDGGAPASCRRSPTACRPDRSWPWRHDTSPSSPWGASVRTGRWSSCAPASSRWRASEAAALLEAAGLRLGAAELDDTGPPHRGVGRGSLPRRPLACGRSATFARRCRGSEGRDRLVADYLRDEFLAPLGPEKTAFLMRTSVLDTLSRAALRRRPRALGIRPHARGAGTFQRAADQPGPERRLVPAPHAVRPDAARRASAPGATPGVPTSTGWRAPGTARTRSSTSRSGTRSRRATYAAAGALLWAGAPAHIAHGRNDTVQSWLKEFSADQIAGCAPLAAGGGQQPAGRRRGR